MAGNDTNFEPSKVNEDTVNYDDLVNDSNASSGVITMGSSMVEASSCPSGPMLDSFCPQIWDQPINAHNLGYTNTNFDTSSSMNWMPKTLLRDSVFIPSVSRNSPHSLPPFPPDSAFIERAVRFSCFSGGSFGETVTPFSVPEPLDCLPRAVRGPNEVNETEGGLLKNEKKGEGLVKCSNEDKVGVDASNNQCDAGETSESSGKGVGVKKRKIIEQKTENNEGTKQEEDTAKDKGDQNPCSTSTHGGKHGKQESQVSDPPKEEYIHVRARRGQATNSHSLAERIRREKISERMKYLQDLVPGCSKVTGKAVMLDEIINYVQSLQRQVEFLSMKLATVNPQLEFNMEGFLAKDIIQSRAGLSSSLVFPPDIAMPFHPLFSSQPGQNPAGLPRLSNSSETLRRPPIGLESTVVCGELSPLTSQQMQAPGVWDDELHNVVHNGFNTSAPLDTTRS